MANSSDLVKQSLKTAESDQQSVRNILEKSEIDVRRFFKSDWRKSNRRLFADDVSEMDPIHRKHIAADAQ